MGSMGCHSSRISYYKLRIIRIELSNNPYPSDIANTKSASASASAHNRIRIIHIRMDIKKSSPNSQTRIGSDAEIIHTTFIPSDGTTGFNAAVQRPTSTCVCREPTTDRGTSRISERASTAQHGRHTFLGGRRERGPAARGSRRWDRARTDAKAAQGQAGRAPGVSAAL
jgi:hypothetical protein